MGVYKKSFLKHYIQFKSSDTKIEKMLKFLLCLFASCAISIPPTRNFESTCVWTEQEEVGSTCPSGMIARGGTLDSNNPSKNSLYCCSTKFQHSTPKNCEKLVIDEHQKHCPSYKNEAKSIYSLKSEKNIAEGLTISGSVAKPENSVHSMECCHNGDVSVTAWLATCLWTYGGYGDEVVCPESYASVGFCEDCKNGMDFGMLCCPFINNPIPQN